MADRRQIGRIGRPELGVWRGHVRRIGKRALHRRGDVKQRLGDGRAPPTCPAPIFQRCAAGAPGRIEPDLAEGFDVAFRVWIDRVHRQDEARSKRSVLVRPGQRDARHAGAERAFEGRPLVDLSEWIEWSNRVLVRLGVGCSGFLLLRRNRLPALFEREFQQRDVERVVLADHGGVERLEPLAFGGENLNPIAQGRDGRKGLVDAFARPGRRRLGLVERPQVVRRRIGGRRRRTLIVRFHASLPAGRSAKAPRATAANPTSQVAAPFVRCERRK